MENQEMLTEEERVSAIPEIPEIPKKKDPSKSPKKRWTNQEEVMGWVFTGIPILGFLIFGLIPLAARRRVIDGIYNGALAKLNALGEKETLALFSRLLDEYAEEGDEVVLSEKFAFPIGAEKIAEKKKLRLSRERAKINGGFILRGKFSDRDISYAALLERDREEYQSELARKLFKLQ